MNYIAKYSYYAAENVPKYQILFADRIYQIKYTAVYIIHRSTDSKFYVYTALPRWRTMHELSYFYFIKVKFKTKCADIVKRERHDFIIVDILKWQWPQQWYWRKYFKIKHKSSNVRWKFVNQFSISKQEKLLIYINHSLHMCCSKSTFEYSTFLHDISVFSFYLYTHFNQSSGQSYITHMFQPIHRIILALKQTPACTCYCLIVVWWLIWVSISCMVPIFAYIGANWYDTLANVL